MTKEKYDRDMKGTKKRKKRTTKKREDKKDRKERKDHDGKIEITINHHHYKK